MRSVITLSGSKYVGMCNPYDPDDNQQVGELADLPTYAYMVPSNGFESYSPIMVIPVSKRHAVVVERDGGSLRLYKINLNRGEYDPLIEECEVPQKNFNPYNVWVDQYVWSLAYDESIVEGYSPRKNRVLIVARDPYPEVGSSEINVWEKYRASFPDWGESYEGTREAFMSYHMYYFDVTHENDIKMLWHEVFRDVILFPSRQVSDNTRYETIYGWGPTLEIQHTPPYVSPPNYTMASAIQLAYSNAVQDFYEVNFPDGESSIIDLDSHEWTALYPEWLNPIESPPPASAIPQDIHDSIDRYQVAYDAEYWAQYWRGIRPPVVDVSQVNATVAWSTTMTYVIGWTNWRRRARALVSSGTTSQNLDPVFGYTGVTKISKDGLREEHSITHLVVSDDGVG